jgi:MFS family permease
LKYTLPQLLHVDLTNTTERNAWYLVLEIFWATFLGAATTFNTAFAIRLGATDTLIGLLTSIPALLGILILIPAGRFLNKRKRSKPWLLGSLMLLRTGYLVIAILPWLKFLGINQGTILVFWLIFLSLPAHFFNVGFLPMLSETIPEHNRANVFTARNVISNTTLSICVLLFGQWLNHYQDYFPVNYQVMYVVTYIVSLLSLFFLLKIQVPQKSTQTLDESPKRGVNIGLTWQKIRQDFKQNPQYTAIVRNTILHALGLWTVAPLYMLYYVRTLEASDAWIGLLGAIASLATIAGFLLWRKWMNRLGESKTLKTTIVMAGLFPLLVGLTPSLQLILVWAGLNGIISGGISLSHMNTLLRVIPENDRTGYTAIYMTVTSIGAFICPMIGVLLGEQFGTAPVLVACGALSILGSFSFWLWPVEK